MGTIKIENEHSLKEAFRSGVNLFVGAGFSIDAKNKKGDKLPLGKNLALELEKNAGTTERDGRNDAKRLCTNVVTVSDEVKPKKRKMQGKAEYSRRTVCKSLPKKM